MNRIVLFLLPLKFISARGHGTPCPYNLDQTCVPILQHLMFAFVALANNYFNNLRDATLALTKAVLQTLYLVPLPLVAQKAAQVSGCAFAPQFVGFCPIPSLKVFH